jgi:hypothetical protein
LFQCAHAEQDGVADHASGDAGIDIFEHNIAKY